MRAIDLQMIEQPDDVFGELVTVHLGIVRLATLAVRAKIHRDRAMLFRHLRKHAIGDEVPIGSAGVAVQHDDRCAGALLDVANLHAV